MEILNVLTNYYENYDEDGRLGSKHGQVEFLTTMRYIEKYLTPSARILEIGAGTGRYSHALARRGYPVDAVELVGHNIELFKQNTQPGEPVTIRQGDATHLDGIADNTYDVTLLLGPMYHLFTPETQRQALCEAIRVTKPGGVIFAAYCNNDTTMIRFCFQQRMILQPRYQQLIDFETFKAASSPDEIFVLYRREDIDALMAGLPVRRLHYVGTGMATSFIRQSVDEMDDDLFALYLRYHFTICERPDMVGVTDHMLDVLRKE